MPTLMSLPNEILISIIDATVPEDVVSISTCCKRVYSLASRRLEEHKLKKSLFSKIFVNVDFQLFPRPLWAPNSPDYNTDLEEFFSDERNHLYPKAMAVKFDPDGFGPMYDSGIARISATIRFDEFERQLESRMAKVHSMIALVVGEIEAAEWDKDVKAGYPLAIFLLLLALLPNLEECEIQTFSYSRHTSSTNYSKIIRIMIEAALGQKENGLNFGGRLTKCAIDGECYESIGESFLPFIMMLPRMQTIQGNTLQIENGSWPFTDAVSPVVDLDLEGLIHIAALRNYVHGIRELKRFRYNCVDDWEIDWEPCGLVAALRQYAFRSLVSLHLSTDSYEMTWREISPGIGSLRSFEVLETIRLHYILLLEDVLIADSTDEVDSAETSETSPEDSLAQPQHLIDFLPSSVRTFQLEAIARRESVLDTFEGFPEHRLERLPNLELISFDADDETISQVKTICDKSGGRVRGWEEAEPCKTWRGDGTFNTWTLEFCA